MKKFFNSRSATNLILSLFLIAFVGLARGDAPVGSMFSSQGTTNFDSLTLSGNLVVDGTSTLTGAFTFGFPIDANGLADAYVFDADADTTISAPTDDQLDFELTGVDQIRMIGVAGIDAAATTSSLELFFTTPVDTTGANTHQAFNCDLAIGNSTAGTNNVACLVIDAIADDAQVVTTAIEIGDEWNYSIDTSAPALFSAQTWFDDFLGDIVKPEYTEASGSDGQAVQAIVQEQYGVYQLTSGDAGANTAGDAEQLALSRNWSADQGSLVFEIRLHLDAAITTVEICVGLTDNVALELPFTNSTDTITAVAADAVAFCFDTNATTDEWWVLGVANTTKATGNAASGVAPTNDVYQVLRIEIDSGGADCRFYIDGVLVGTITANCVTNTVLLAPVIVISSAQTASSHVVDVDYWFISADRD